MSVTATQLSEFLDWLRDGGSGFDVGDRQYLAAQSLMETLAARGEWPADKDSWRTLLAPVLCSSPLQQQHFYDLLDQWFLTPQNAQRPASLGDDALGGARRRPISRAVWVYGVLSVAVASVLIFGVVRSWQRLHRVQPASTPTNQNLLPVAGTPPEQPKPTTVTITVQTEDGKPIAGAIARYHSHNPVQAHPFDTDSSGHAVLDINPESNPLHLVVAHKDFHSAVLDFPQADTSIILHPASTVLLPVHGGHWYDHAQAFRFAILTIAGVLVLVWLIHLWRKALELRRWASTSEPRMRRIGMSHMAEPLFQSADIRKLAVALRRRRPEESPELDLQCTVDTTCREAGYFTPVFAKRNSEPEYLFLGERKNLRDHQARLQDELILRLRQHDVYVQRYYFQSSPSVCSDAKGEVYSFAELAAMHPDHEVWLALDSNRCLDPVSGTPERWCGQLPHWQYRVLLSFSRTEVDSDLRITDPTRSGIEALVLDSAQPAGTEHYPSLLQETPEGWLSRLEPPPAAIARLNAQLQRYLGEHGYLLLQATAVYPDIAWNITTSLAAVLIPAAEREAVLNRLAALPWFRHGIMPDWLRVRLVSRLGPNEPKVREAVRRFLDRSVDSAPQSEDVLEIVPGTPRKGAGKTALQDNVYLAFASGSKLDQLSVQAPRGFRKFLRDSVWLRAAAALVIMALLWFGTKAGMDRLLRRSHAGPDTRTVHATHPDPFVTLLMQVAEGRESTTSPTDDALTQLKTDSAIASEVANTNDPFATLSTPADLDHIARKLSPGEPIQPGMVVLTTRGPELVKAVEGNDVMTYGASGWVPVQEFGGAYDLSGIQSDSRGLATRSLTAGGPSWEFRGEVINLVTQLGIAGVEVDAEGDTTAHTDESGRFSLRLPSPQQEIIHLRFRKEGYTEDTVIAPSGKPYIEAIAPLDTAARKLQELGDDLRAPSPDGRLYATSGASKLITVWESASGHKLRELRGPMGRVTSLAWASDGRRLTSTSDDGEKRTWDVATGQLLQSQPGIDSFTAVLASCNAGNLADCTKLGGMYGVPKDYLLSMADFRKACDGGNAPACSRLGAIYETGLGVSNDSAKAAALYRKACDLGDAPSCERLKNPFAQTADTSEGEKSKASSSAASISPSSPLRSGPGLQAPPLASSAKPTSQSAVSGTVGSRVAGAAVHLINKTIQPPFDMLEVTDSEGRFFFDNIPPGKGYSVEMYSATGEVLASERNIELVAGQAHILNRSLIFLGRAPQVIYKPKPVYTAEATALHIEGEVKILIKVSANGNVTVLQVTQSLGHGLDQAAINCAKGLRFKPELDVAGKPIDWQGAVIVRFQVGNTEVVVQNAIDATPGP